MKVLVTGGSGYLGTHVRRHFDAADLSRRSGLDILNLQDVLVAADHDIVIHLAACLDKSPDAAEEVFLTNVEGTINILRVMRPDSVFIFASTKDVYGRFADKYREVPEDCPTLYAGQTALEWSKLIAERYVEFYAARTGFRSCIFRLSNVYAPPSEGNLPGFIGDLAERIDRGLPLLLPAGGRPRRDLLHVSDLSSACEAFIDSVVRHGLYNLGGGPQNADSLSGIVDQLEKASGANAASDPDAETLPDPVPFNYVSDLSRVKHELGWSPAIDLKEGLRSLFRGE